MTIAERVASILKHDTKSRDSDKRLMLVYMQRAGMNLSDEQVKLFYKLPSMETIRRTRQSLQMQGRYPASKVVEQQRYAKFQEMRGGGYLKPEETLEHPADTRPMKVIIDELFPN